MSFHTYILRCADGTYYTGHTDNLDLRFAQHQSGEVQGYTADRRPLELMWSKQFATRAEALACELQIKGWSRRKKEALIAGDWQGLKEASVSVSAPASPTLGSALRLRSGRTEEADEPGALSPRPVIVLVRPQLGENIGKAARAMLNFGLTEMRLVTPRDGWPNPAAGPAAAGADEVLANAQVFETLADAVADCPHVYATTVRKRGVTKPVVTPEEAARDIHLAQGRSAIVFGPERSGLETDDVALARAILTVPINPEFGSLNLAQAVILCAYEWSKQAALSQPTHTDLLPPAPQEELEGMIAQLDGMLEQAGYFYPPDRAPATRRTLRGVLTKPGWNSLEVRTLRGVLSALANPRPR
ncbi:tRNA/rRNA methyltransferase [Sphingobium sp. B7D2B]|uniref:TrmJ/YjtD family RNA methyltransferase n=1 Tax=Sphingobium sp. B7D2B TaxID=2940583 RepID=UPI002224DEB8|nr:TrmJ/YjtD family RNA methyltransferase [Sphingobium sp. B7D2B]MCW2366799.1 tRNA/rRNA methyltransferase [Sphingobium sp. B7D2B]